MHSTSVPTIDRRLNRARTIAARRQIDRLDLIEFRADRREAMGR